MLEPVGSDTVANPYPGSANRLAATLQPELPDFFGAPVPLANQVDRVVWFTNVNPDNGLRRQENASAPIAGFTRADGQVFGDLTAGDGFVDFAPLDSQNLEQIFYNRFAAADYPFQDTDVNRPLTEVYLRGGQYAVVGPRETTHIGSLQEFSGTVTHLPTTSEPQVTYAEYESPQSLLLGSTGFDFQLFTGSSAMPTVSTGAANQTIRPPVGIIAAANPPAGFVAPPILGTTNAIGVNVSEPLPGPAPTDYYLSPTEPLSPGFPVDSYYNYDTAAGNFPDEPFDTQTYAELEFVFPTTGQQTGTRERFKTAYLQRLADPTEPHDEITNPYRTVDYITIDLTVFNGSDGNTEETDTSIPLTEWTDAENPDPFGSDPVEAFGTRYKSGRTIFDATTAAWTENLSHSVNTVPPTAMATAHSSGGHVPYFDFQLSLQDFVNPDVTAATAPLASATDNTPVRTAHSSTLGYANASYGPRWVTSGGADFRYAGAPTSNWFSAPTWLDRPYVSPAELMWVPTTSNGTFAANFGTTTANTGFIVGNLYEDASGAAVAPRAHFNHVFPHLWNLLSNNLGDYTNSPNLNKILDFVDVPAPYDFEADFISTNVNVLAHASATSTASSSFDRGAGRFNYGPLSTTPGDATGDPSSWNATGVTTADFWLDRFTIEALRPPLNIRQPQFRQGRINLNTIKGEAVYRALMEGITDSGDPAAGAFAGGFADSRRGYVPAAGTQPIVPAGYGATNPINFSPDHAGQFTGAFKPANLSDVAPIATDRVNPNNRTFLRPGGVTGAFSDSPLFSKGIVDAGTLTEQIRARSTAHQQLPITRLNNLATNQSNTFAVWVTVGLFKVDGATMQVREELGSDLGESRRYRSFYIIDRSVPVKYEPGVLNNADETVQLSRKLN